eukprot:352122-Chlamydomonas_euryale.AAC.8
MGVTRWGDTMRCAGRPVHPGGQPRQLRANGSWLHGSQPHSSGHGLNGSGSMDHRESASPPSNLQSCDNSCATPLRAAFPDLDCPTYEVLDEDLGSSGIELRSYAAGVHACTQARAPASAPEWALAWALRPPPQIRPSLLF